MKTKLHLISVFCVLLAIAPQASFAWTMTATIQFVKVGTNDEVWGGVSGTSPESESAIVVRMLSSVQMLEEGILRDEDGDVCTERLTTGFLICPGVAIDKTLTDTCLYRAIGGIIADFGDPPAKSFNLQKLYRAGPGNK